MAYLKDEDLEFLKYCSNEELGELFDIIVYGDKDSKQKDSKRFTETLTSSNEYKVYGKNYKKYWEKIAEELQLFGGNTIVNMFRGTGVLYSEIAKDVAKQYKIDLSDYNGDIEVLEGKIIEAIINKMPEKELKLLMDEIAGNIPEFKGKINKTLLSTILLRNGMKYGGFKTYQISLIVINFIWKRIFGRGLTLAVNTGITKVIAGSLSGPVGWALNIWLLFDIASPATRVTIPSVLYISLLRQKVKQELN